MFYTYKITCIITGRIYFGYTSTTVEERFYKHSTERRNTIIKRSFQKYGKENHIVETVGVHDTEEQGKQHECMLIATYQTNAIRFPNGNGMNLTDGGEGCKGYKHTDVWRQSRKGHTMNIKTVYQFSQQGELIHTWPSAKDAAAAIGAYGADISKCCRGIIRSVKGFVFSYNSTFNGREAHHSSAPIAIRVTHNNQSSVYQSKKAAANAIGCYVSSINNSLKTKKPIKGFFVEVVTYEHLLDEQSLHIEHPS